MSERAPGGQEVDAEIQRLLAEVGNGNGAAFAGIVERYQRKVFGMALAYTRNRATAEDLVQEVFMAVYQSLPRYDPKRSFTNWILRITQNQCCKALRKRQPLPCEHLEAVVEFDPAAETVKQEEREEILGAFHALQEDFRLVVWLFYFLDRNLAQIADILDISVNLAKIRLFRARQAMAGMLAKSRETAAKMFQETL